MFSKVTDVQLKVSIISRIYLSIVGELARRAACSIDEALREMTSTFLHNLIPNELSANSTKSKILGKSK